VVEQTEEVKEIVITDVAVEEPVEVPETAEEVLPEPIVEIETPVENKLEPKTAIESDKETNRNKFISPKDLEAKKVKGLKVVGKIDLGESKKKKYRLKKKLQ